jgi:hypothetical protein
MSASGFSTDGSIDQIENLVENLYEGLPEKITAAKSVLQLAKRPENLAALAENGTSVSRRLLSLFIHNQ